MVSRLLPRQPTTALTRGKQLTRKHAAPPGFNNNKERGHAALPIT